MVPRYTRPEMAAIWSPEARFRIWFEIEALAAEAMAELGTIPAEAARAIRARGRRPHRRHDRRPTSTASTRSSARPATTSSPSSPGWARPAPIGRHGRARPLHAPGHDQLRRARHRPVRPAHPRRRPAARRPRRPAGGAAPPRRGARADADHRPLPRHPRRAHHLRPQARRPLRRVRARPEAPARRARGDRDLPPSPAPSAPSPPSTRAVEALVAAQARPRGPSPSPPRSSRATATPPSSAPWPSSRAAIERLATEVRHLQRTEVREAEEYFHPGQKGSSRHAPQAQPGAVARTSPASPASCAATPCRRWRTSRSGTSATSATARRARDRPRRHHRARLRPRRARPAWWTSCRSTPSGCAPTSKASAASCTAARSCSPSPRPGMSREDAYAHRPALRHGHLGEARPARRPLLPRQPPRGPRRHRASSTPADLDAVMDPPRDFTHVRRPWTSSPASSRKREARPPHCGAPRHRSAGKRAHLGDQPR